MDGTSPSWDPGKLFVGGISWETGETALKRYFTKYGEVLAAIAVRDRSTGNPRGFAFVQFSDDDAVGRVLNDEDGHFILGRKVEVKRARPRIDQHQHQNQNPYENRGQNRNGINSISSNNNRSHIRSKKIFVGGLPSDITEGVFRAYFEGFGNITDAVVIYDNVTHRPRGFGFVEFELEAAVERVMQKGIHELNNKHVEVKRALPKDGLHGQNHRHVNSSNVNTHNPRTDTGSGYGFGYYPGGVYPTYVPRYGPFNVYAPVPISGYTYGPTGYGGGYAIGVDGRVAYGPPFSSPTSPWSNQGIGAERQNPVPYGSTTVYPGYSNGGFGGYFGMGYGGYYGLIPGNDNGNQIESDVQKITSVAETITSQVKSLKLDAQ